MGEPRKVYLATSGEYSDYRVCHVFTRREDAEAYPLGDDVEERELRDGPVEVRARHCLWWNAYQSDHEGDGHRMGNPWSYSHDADFESDDGVSHRWDEVGSGMRLYVEGWDRARVLKVYSEQRAQHEAQRAGIS